LNNKPILLIGLGNPILGDDGVGWHIAKEVKERLSSEPDVEVDFASVGGLGLMERLVGYECVIIVDAITDRKYPLGTLIVSKLEDLPIQSQGHLCSAHDISLQDALELGKLAGAKIPAQIIIVGIEAEAVYDFSDQLSPTIKQVVPEVAQCVINLIHKEL
jgi:hydrogenase maturation protease